jgi:NurA-like 5'-3' nuclease
MHRGTTICSMHEGITSAAKELIGYADSLEEEYDREVFKEIVQNILGDTSEAWKMGQRMEDGLREKRDRIVELEKELSQAERDRDEWQAMAEGLQDEVKYLNQEIESIKEA